MNFSQAIRICFRKYADFTGRAARPEFWWFALFQCFVTLGLIWYDEFWLEMVAGAALLLPSLAVSARRLHDIGKSGWWTLLYMIPVLGALVLICWWALSGQPGENDYGPEAGGESGAPGQC